MKPRIVVSAVNFVEMGPLTVLSEALQSLVETIGSRCEIVALVHRRELISTAGVTCIEFPGIKGSWIRRLRFEFVDCLKISRRLKPHLWVALHDITPCVVSERQVVYCHNPSPFYSFRLREALLDPKFGMFTLFYRYLYGIHLHRNAAIIVQQDWMRDEFERRYCAEKVIVAHPTVKLVEAATPDHLDGLTQTYRFFYPAFSRTFKNHELLLEAVKLLERDGIDGFEVSITVDARSNRCGANLFRRYSKLRSVRWLGVIPRERVYKLYGESDCLVFPSKLETWGLPLTEFKSTRKPILAADLPYAHEAIGSYGQIVFFDVKDAENLAAQMEMAIRGDLKWRSVSASPIRKPFAKDWAALWALLLPDLLPSTANVVNINGNPMKEPGRDNA